MCVHLLASLLCALVTCGRALQPKGIPDKISDLAPSSRGFSLADMLSGNLPHTLGSWANVVQDLRHGKLPSTELSEAMSSTMSHKISDVGNAGSTEFEESLKTPAVQAQLQNFIRDPTLLKEKIQNSSIVKQLEKVNPTLANFVRSPDVLQLVLKSMQKGESIAPAVQKMLDDAASQGIATSSPSETSWHKSPTGWSVSENGLQLKSIRKGDGKTFPTPGDTVSVHYTGYMKDGKKFDSSLDRGLFNFTLGQSEVIQGWDLGLTHMSLGEKAVLQVPSSLAYGSSGIGPIPPNADLIFEIILLAIAKPAKTI